MAVVLAVQADQDAASARHQAQVARSLSLAVQSRVEEDERLDLSLLLGVEAFEASEGLDSIESLQARSALLSGHLAQPPLRALLTGLADRVFSVAYSPDGTTFASGSFDGTIRLWDVASRSPLGEPLTGHTDAVTSVAFSRDGTTLASGSHDRAIRLWDVASWSPLGEPLTGHELSILSVAFSPDGTTLASGSDDDTHILRDIDPASWRERSCGRANHSLSLSGLERLLPGEEYCLTCAGLPPRQGVDSGTVSGGLSEADSAPHHDDTRSAERQDRSLPSIGVFRRSDDPKPLEGDEADPRYQSPGIMTR